MQKHADTSYSKGFISSKMHSQTTFPSFPHTRWDFLRVLARNGGWGEGATERPGGAGVDRAALGCVWSENELS